VLHNITCGGRSALHVLVNQGCFCFCSPVNARNIQLLLNDAAKLGIQHSKCITLSILLQELFETWIAQMASEPSFAQMLYGAVVCIQKPLFKLGNGGVCSVPLLSLLSTRAAAAARASVVFSNLLKALSLTTLRASSGVLKSLYRSCTGAADLGTRLLLPAALPLKLLRYCRLCSASSCRFKQSRRDRRLQCVPQPPATCPPSAP